MASLIHALASRPSPTLVHVREQHVRDVTLQISVELRESQRETERAKIVIADANQFEHITRQIVSRHGMIHE